MVGTEILELLPMPRDKKGSKGFEGALIVPRVAQLPSSVYLTLTSVDEQE